MVIDLAEGKASEALGDHMGWLEDAPKGHLQAFRGRRDEPDAEASFNQNEFDAGESFRTKAKGLSQLALQRQKLLSEGRHVRQQLKVLDSRIQSTEAREGLSTHVARSAESLQGTVDRVGGDFAKATAAFHKAMALETAFKTDKRKMASVPAPGRHVERPGAERSKARTWASAEKDDQAAGGALFKV